MALSRLFLAWLAVAVWLLIWELVASRPGAARGNGRLRRARVFLVEALLLTLFGALWFGSLGSGAWWLVFGLVGALREWPGPRGRRPGENTDLAALALAALGVLRTVAAGGLLAWRLGPA
ncbi:MAG TPA: hypothetical protein VF061_07720 [Gemmatimonadales bacterium]|jgi:hypothetical protein